MYTIKNEQLEATISLKGAEVHKLNKVNEEYNYVWCGDKNVWGGRNPILFPQVGSTSDKTIKIDGVKRPIGNHGFVRSAEFNLVCQKEDELTLNIKENEESMKCYPYKFTLTVNYKLVANKLNVKYTIKNDSDKVMPFGFGLHPAFACAHDYEDTKVVFDVEEDFGKELVISKELFQKYPTFSWNNPKSTKAMLHTGDRVVGINYPGYNIFAIWSLGDYVCLEPWINHAPEDPEIEFKDREGTMFLNPGEEKVIEYSWEVEK